MGLMQFENTSGGNKFFGYVWTVLEIGLKIALVVMLVLWRNHVNEADRRKSVGEKATFNAELGYW